jgi:hypothetical protein
VTTNSDSSDESARLISHQYSTGDRDEIALCESDERIDEMGMALGPRGQSPTSDAHVERATGLATRDAFAQEAGTVLTGVCNQASTRVEDGDRHGRKAFGAGVTQAVLDDDLRICEGDHGSLDVVAGARRWPRHRLVDSDKLNW